MTLLEIVNKILLRLREDTVLTVTSTEYSRLVAEFVVDRYKELQEHHDWEANKHDLVFNTAASQTRYVLSRNVTSGGDALDSNTRLPNTQSIIVLDRGMPNAFVYDDASDPYGDRMTMISDANRRTRQAQDSDTTVDEPWLFSITNDGVDLYLDLAHKPSSVKRIKVMFKTNQTDLATDGSDDSTEVYLPWRPIMMGALSDALNERGEEIGEPGNVAERRYIAALGAALEADMAYKTTTNVYDWYRQ